MSGCLVINNHQMFHLRFHFCLNDTRIKAHSNRTAGNLRDYFRHPDSVVIKETLEVSLDHIRFTLKMIYEHNNSIKIAAFTPIPPLNNPNWTSSNQRLWECFRRRHLIIYTINKWFSIFVEKILIQWYWKAFLATISPGNQPCQVKNSRCFKPIKEETTRQK